MMPRLLPLTVAASLALAGIARAAPCHAQELSDDLALVQAGWAKVSERTTRLSARFLQPGQTLPVRLPESALAANASGCTSLAIVGSRTTSFTVVVGSERVSARMPRPASSHRSSAGVAVISRCAAARSELSELAVRLNGGRGALEFLLSQGAQQAPAVETFLPERQPGPTASLADVGFTPDVEPTAVRVSDAERRMQSMGARLASRRTLQPPVHGGASIDVSFEPGCHRLVLLPETGPGRPVDVDAELLDVQDRTLVRDRSNATDAVLDLCVGVTTAAQLAWIASNRGARVTLLHASWAIPSGMPYDWGPRARAALAASHRKRQSPQISSPPQWEATGLPGRTSIPVNIDPEGCYLVGVAPSRGDLRAVTLAVAVGPSHHHDTGGGGYESALVGFCARGARTATIDVEASGNGLHWVSGLWRTGRMPLGSAEAW
jgi:hypothetical protein